MTQRNLMKLGVMAILAAGLTGCPSAGIYRSAKTLEPGVGDFNTNFNVTKLTQKQKLPVLDDDGNLTTEEKELSFTFPNVVGEYAYHIGVAPNVEVGGRLALASGLMELDVKYRFLGSDDSKLHVAINPGVGYRSFGLVDGTSINVPLLLTYDLTPNFSVTVGGFGNMSFLNSAVEGEDSDSPNLGGNTTSFGGAAGVMISGDTFFLYPVVEFGTITASSDDADDDSGDSESSFDTQYMQVGLNIGVVYGREMQAIKKMDKKLDKIDGKLDKALEK